MDNIGLPIKRKLSDSVTEHSLHLGMIFTRPPFSTSTRAHGFHALIEVPDIDLPDVNCTAPVVQNHEQDSEKINYSRFKYFREEAVRSVQPKRKEVRCIIDFSIDISIVLESAVEKNGAMLEINMGDLALEDHLIDCEKFILGAQVAKIYIDGRQYFGTFPFMVVKELFPNHEGVNIDVVLGKDFLSAFPGLPLRPVISGGFCEFIPWVPDDSVNDSRPPESFLNVNEKGELLVYVSGYEDPQEILNSRARILAGDVTEPTDEKGAYGVFFGANSPWNISLLSEMNGTPIRERALVEGIIAVSDLLIQGGFIYGNPIFTSVRIFTDSELVVDFLNSDTKIAECLERNWINKNGMKLGIAEPLKYWYDSLPGKNQLVSRVPWVKERFFIFERLEKERSGLQAARHLAMCGLKTTQAYHIHWDLDDTHFPHASLPQDTFTGDKLNLIYINPPRAAQQCTFGHKLLIKQRVSDYTESRDQASAKAPREDLIDLAQPYSAKDIITEYLQPGNLYSFDTVIPKFSATRKYKLKKILEVFDGPFIQELLRLAKEKGYLPDSVEFFKEVDGKIHFFNKNPVPTLEDPAEDPVDSLVD